MDTPREYIETAKKISIQAKNAVLQWFIRRDGLTSFTIDDFYVTWIAKVSKHFKARVEFRNGATKTGSMVFDVDIFENGERVVSVYDVVALTVYNIQDGEPALIGFDQ